MPAVIHYVCRHCVDLHVSRFQRPPARWADEPDETHTDECPRTGLLVVYHLREVVLVEPKD